MSKKYFVRLLDDKMFLCSRDIQPGDEVHYSGDHNITWKVDSVTEVSFRSGPGEHAKRFAYKVIGEISPDALSFVTEGQEFDENKVEMFYYDSEDQEEYDWYQANHTEMQELGFIPYVRVKGPCGHFH